MVSSEFGRSKTFTIIEVENGEVKSVNVIENPAASLSHGRGPIVTKNLANTGVSVIISGEVGPGASTMLDDLGRKKLLAKPGEKVIDALKELSIIKG
ncbi:MAG: NifB/NifX family molybdenum-iron cluster-binding protein [Candidatus Bathyarchaeia archaeon]